MTLQDINSGDIVSLKFQNSHWFLHATELWLRVHFPLDWVDAGCWDFNGTKVYPSVLSFFDSIISDN